MNKNVLSFSTKWCSQFLFSLEALFHRLLYKYIQDEIKIDLFLNGALLLYAKAYYMPHIYFFV